MVNKIFVLGASGLLGSNWVRLKQKSYDVFGSYLTFPGREMDRPGAFFPLLSERRVRLDLGRFEEVSAALRNIRPDWVINAAGLTDGGRAQAHPEECRKINVLAPRLLAEECRRLGMRLVHISTDLVFDGKKGEYRETDRRRPLGVYARSKASAEDAVLTALPGALVIRTALIYGRSPRGNRSVNEKLVLRARNSERIRLFIDEIRTPILVDDLVEAVEALMRSSARGIYHVAGPERVSRFEFGMKILRAAGMDPGQIEAAHLEDWTGTPPRAPDVSLDVSKLLGTADVRLHDLTGGLKAVYPDGSASKPAEAGPHSGMK